MDKWKDIELEKMKVHFQGPYNFCQIGDASSIWIQIGNQSVNCLFQRWVEIRKHASFSKINPTTMIQCPSNKNTIRKRPLCIAIRFQHWLKANHGAKKHRKHPIIRVQWYRTHKSIPIRAIRIANETRLRQAKATKIWPMEIAIKTSTRENFATKKRHSSIAFKRRMPLDRSMQLIDIHIAIQQLIQLITFFVTEIYRPAKVADMRALATREIQCQKVSHKSFSIQHWHL